MDLSIAGSLAAAPSCLEFGMGATRSTSRPPKLRVTAHAVDGLRRCECYNLYDRIVPYAQAWQWQRSLVSAYATAIEESNQEEAVDKVLLLQHEPVYTMGTRSSPDFLRFDRDNPPCELHVTERGGQVTYHGPGQLVMYPILSYRAHGADLHRYLRSLEEVVIRALRSAYSLEASRLPGFTGVWIGEEKVAAIGIRVSRGVTYHGLALNVTTDLAPFEAIVPCGIADKAVASVAKLVGERNDDMLERVQRCMLDAFSLVFDVELVQPKVTLFL